MKITQLPLDGLKLIEPTIFEDERGFFFESFNQKQFSKQIGLDIQFVQDNHSRSKKNVLRGLHYQQVPYSQGKLIRVAHGKIFDVAVDIRQNSPTFGRWHAEVLSSENRFQLWIPDGFAHGFLTLSGCADVLYKTTTYWNAESEICILWNDSKISIQWPLRTEPILSEKDKKGHHLHELFNSQEQDPRAIKPTRPGIE
jgi:dTDP-4-dehydrorhamnose 3,5-epimerase